jgi:hypothetical protein
VWRSFDYNDLNKEQGTHPMEENRTTSSAVEQGTLPSDPFHLHTPGADDVGVAISEEIPPVETTDMIRDIASIVGEATEVDASMVCDVPTLAKDPVETKEVGTGDGSTTNSTSVAEDALEIWEPEPLDVLTGRGASINVHPGNQKFRALCYARKSQFDAANHAAKKRIATEIWTTCVQLYNSRFLKRRQDKGPWYQQSAHHAILKAAQTIRDYQRPDRLLQRDAGTKKRRCTPATPMDEVVIPLPPEGPIVENPAGVEANDVLCGRGAVRRKTIVTLVRSFSVFFFTAFANLFSLFIVTNRTTSL